MENIKRVNQWSVCIRFASRRVAGLLVCKSHVVIYKENIIYRLDSYLLYSVLSSVFFCWQLSSEMPASNLLPLSSPDGVSESIEIMLNIYLWWSVFFFTWSLVLGTSFFHTSSLCVKAHFAYEPPRLLSPQQIRNHFSTVAYSLIDYQLSDKWMSCSFCTLLSAISTVPV